MSYHHQHYIPIVNYQIWIIWNIKLDWFNKLYNQEELKLNLIKVCSMSSLRQLKL